MKTQVAEVMDLVQQAYAEEKLRRKEKFNRKKQKGKKSHKEKWDDYDDRQNYRR